MSDKKQTIKEPLATLGDRLVAYIIDFFVMQIPVLIGGVLVLIAWGIVAIIEAINKGGMDELFVIVLSIVGVISILLWIGFDIYYLIWWPIKHEGQTVGKKVKKIRITIVEDLNNGKIRRMTEGDIGVMLLRLVFSVVDRLFFWLVGLYLINNNPNRQRFADQQAKTVVISDNEQ